MNWYCVHTKPQKEAQVATYCRETLQLETYFPRLRQYRTIRRVRKLVTKPLFPRYLFCRFDPGASYRSVRYAPDALDLVRAGDQPAVVADALITELKQWAGDEFDVITLNADFGAGESVEITAGPMRGMSATILHASADRERVTILLSILQHGAQMMIDRAHLRRLETENLKS
jgi:transcriptional antiterminator RfaH